MINSEILADFMCNSLTRMVCRKLYTRCFHPVELFHSVNNGNHNISHHNHLRKDISSFPESSIEKKKFMWINSPLTNYQLRVIRERAELNMKKKPSKPCEPVQFRSSFQLFDAIRWKPHFPV